MESKLVSIRLLHLFHTAKAAARRGSRFAGSHALLQVLFQLHVEVKLEFCVKRPIERPLPKRGFQPCPKVSHPSLRCAQEHFDERHCPLQRSALCSPLDMQQEHTIQLFRMSKGGC